MALNFAKILKYMRKPGRILKRELNTPETGLGRQAYQLGRTFRKFRGQVRRSESVFDRRTLLAFYDLGRLPITYDFIWYIVAADLARRQNSLERVHFVFVPGRDWETGPENQAYYTVLDGPARQQRLYDILLPATRLLPTAAGVSLLGSRKEASLLVDQCDGQLFPLHYSPEWPYSEEHFSGQVIDAARKGQAIPPLEAPSGARNWIERWRAGLGNQRPIVTITLRYFDHTPVRNSNLEAWGSFARELEGRGYCPVIVPDTHMTLDRLPSPLDGLTVFVEAAWNLHLRMALYEAAHLNLGVNTGPMALCWFSQGIRYVIYKRVIENAGVATLEAQLERGFDPRKPFPFATPYQHFVAEPDDLNVIRREFDAMEALIEADAAKPTASSV